MLKGKDDPELGLVYNLPLTMLVVFALGLW